MTVLNLHRSLVVVLSVCHPTISMGDGTSIVCPSVKYYVLVTVPGSFFPTLKTFVLGLKHSFSELSPLSKDRPKTHKDTKDTT